MATSSGNRTPGDDFALFFANSPLACHSLDYDGHILLVNPAWLRLLGYREDEVKGRPFADFVAPGFRRQYASGLKMLQTGDTPGSKVMGLVRSNGTEISVEADVTADFATKGTAGRTYAILRDLSNQPRDVRDQGNLARRHSLILNATPGAIIGFDDQGHVTFANPATEKITGWPLQDLYGTNLHQSIHGVKPDGTPNPASECPSCQALKQRESARGETWFQHRNGAFFPVAFHSQPYFVDGVYTGGVISFSDISEQYEARQALEATEHKFRHLFHHAPVALWLEDFSVVKRRVDEIRSSGVTDFDAYFCQHPSILQECVALIKVNAVNQAAIEMHAAKSAEHLIANLSQTMTTESMTTFRQELVALTQGKPGIEALTVLRTLTGEMRPAMVKVFRDPSYSDWSRTYVALTDLTEARNVADMNRRLVTAIEQSADSVVITDREGVIQYCNPAFEAISGYKREEALGRTPRVLKSGFHDDHFYQTLWREITAGQVWTGHFVNRTKQGETYEEEGSISPVFDSNGEITNFVAVKRDVTRQIAMEKQLIQSQKMEAVGQLAGGIAHDFNNILHAMLGHLEFAAAPDCPPDELREELGQLKNSAERAANLTHQLLAFSRRQVLDLQPVQVNELVSNLLKMVRRVIGEDIQLEFQPGNINRQVRADAAQIDQVLLNLCLNARDAMPDGGQLRLKTELADVGNDFVVAHPWAQVGPHVCITVRDTGTGIPPNVMAQIFDPFFTTKEAGRGTGLGLATAYGIIKQHEGMIIAESEVGHGTIFSIYLPVFAADQAPEAEAGATAAKAPGGTETILLAEDSEPVREVVSRILGRAGYRIIEAHDGRQAMEILDARGDDIDLALLDMVMPHAGGPEVALHIQQNRPDVKILFNTGYSEDAVRGRIPPSLNAPLLMKPHSPHDLLVTIRQLLDDSFHR